MIFYMFESINKKRNISLILENILQFFRFLKMQQIKKNFGTEKVIFQALKSYSETHRPLKDGCAMEGSVKMTFERFNIYSVQ